MYQYDTWKFSSACNSKIALNGFHGKEMGKQMDSYKFLLNWRLLTNCIEHELHCNEEIQVRMRLHTPNREEINILWLFEYFTMKIN